MIGQQHNMLLPVGVLLLRWQQNIRFAAIAAKIILYLDRLSGTGRPGLPQKTSCIYPN
jgi:hypothetical protein